MDMIELNNGLKIPAIGYGTYPQKETLAKNAAEALSAGYRLFDTADNYKNESFLGQAIRENAGFGEALVISKFSQANRTKALETCFEESRERLSGKLDIYLLHWPYPYLWKEQWRRMEKLYAEGRCKAIGVCNFETDRLRELLAFCKIPPAVDQIERHPMFQQREIVSFCRDNGIRVMCYSPTARHDAELFGSEVLKALAEKYGKTVGQIILRWDVDTGTIPIPASGSAAHIRENMDIGDFRLTEEEIAGIDALERGKRIRFDPKTRFSLKQKVRFALTRAGLSR